MAVSGAAVSPTSGRSTHPIKAFVFGVLNARLGLWVGNPREGEVVRVAKPKLGGFTVLKEMLGLRGKFGKWIHLSDGGHFENLGIYELLRRGCRRVIAIDASCDPRFEFSDLANAIRRARIDLGIEIVHVGDWRMGGKRDFNGIDIKNKNLTSEVEADAWTAFDIVYAPDLPRGRLLYVKPCIHSAATLPVEIRSYLNESPNFPHETTADQFFTERQLEAYRALGERCVTDALSHTIGIGKTASEDRGLTSLLLRRARTVRPAEQRSAPTPRRVVRRRPSRRLRNGAARRAR
jgi:hypothetical protein